MERSESGAPIYRHGTPDRPFEAADGDAEHIEKISDHIETHIGPVTSVLHELVSDLIHLDIHVVAPTPERDFYTLVTSGMSERPMAAPEPYADLQYSELMLCLPNDWPMEESDWKREEHYWPIRSLKYLARFPHRLDTWLWAMHTVPNGDPAEAFASNTEMCCILLASPVTAGDDFHELTIDDRTVHFHALIPLHRDEVDLKLEKGAEALFDGFDRRGVSELLDPGRPSSIKKKGFFGLW